MCGIGGILRTDGEPIPDEWLDAIDDRIAYRGPDGHGRFRDRVEFTDDDGKHRVVEVAFVHRRMSIIDLEDGHQPMVSKRGRNESEGLVAVVFNGCIYNHRELRVELESVGHTFATDHSDTEVLIHGWREWGDLLFGRLEGMFALGLWDRAQRMLVVARDWYAKKPVYVVESEHRFDGAPQLVAFSSRPPWSRFPTQPSIGSMRPFLQRGYWFGPVGGREYVIYEVEPHNSYYFQPDQAQIGDEESDYWEQVSESPPSSVEEALEQAVARRLEADVALGCFLSGGVDSSLIAHFAKQHKPDLMTFSVRVPDARYDESAHAETVAQHLGTEHHTLELSMNPADDLVHLIELLGQPFGDSSILPTYWVSKAARQHVKVALSGDGGDELFVGYERYLAAPILARHHRLFARIPSAMLRKAHPKSRITKFARLGDMARDYPRIGIAAMESIFLQDQIEDLLDRHMEEAPPGRLGAPPAKLKSGFAAIATLRWFDIENYLPGDLLRKVDTASMAVALEVRCPFLDRDLAAAVLAMPIDQLIPGGQRKGFLRNIARKYLPKECVDRPKMGFAIPIGEWFRSDYGGMKTLLLDHLNSTEPFGPIELNQKAVQRFVDEHMSGRRDHSHRLFTLLTLSIWAKQVASRQSG